MAHFAHVVNGVVDYVAVISQETLDAHGGWRCPECRQFGAVSEWVQTSYNTLQGVHTKGGEPLRKNYAGKGYKYDVALDAFIPPKPFESFVLNEQKGDWDAPVEKPVDGKPYEWSEEKTDWVEAPSKEVTPK